MNVVRRTYGINQHGFSLLEMIVVIAIMGTLITMATLAGKQWMQKSQAESEVRKMHSDLLVARARAMEKVLTHFAVITPSNYAIYEDSNNDGGNGPDAGDSQLSTTSLKYPALSTTTIIIGPKGIISTSTNTTDSWPVNIFFNTGSASPEYDCFQLYATRINLGKSDGGGNCVAR